MKARLPDSYQKGSTNVQSMMKQAQKMQEDMANIQTELEQTEYSVSVGGGAVELTMTGKHEVTKIHIKPEVVDPEDTEMLEDLIMSAVNEAVRQADEDSEEKMGSITNGLGGLNLPAGLSSLF